MLTLPAQRGAWAWHALLVEFPGLSDVIFRFLGPAPDVAERARRARIFSGFAPEEPRPFALCLAATSLDWLLLQQPNLEPRALVERRSATRVARALRQSLRISNDETQQLADSLEGVGILLGEPPPGVAVLKRFLARPTARLSRTLLNSLICHAGSSRVSSVQAQLDELSKTEFAPPPLVTGDDLTVAGLTPGPIFKKALDQAYDAQLEGRVGTKEQALDLAVRLVRAS
jgi:hypothetical protein